MHAEGRLKTKVSAAGKLPRAEAEVYKRHIKSVLYRTERSKAGRFQFLDQSAIEAGDTGELFRHPFPAFSADIPPMPVYGVPMRNTLYRTCYQTFVIRPCRRFGRNKAVVIP